MFMMRWYFNFGFALALCVEAMVVYVEAMAVCVEAMAVCVKVGRDLLWVV